MFDVCGAGGDGSVKEDIQPRSPRLHGYNQTRFEENDVRLLPIRVAAEVAGLNARASSRVATGV